MFGFFRRSRERRVERAEEIRLIEFLIAYAESELKGRKVIRGLTSSGVVPRSEREIMGGLDSCVVGYGGNFLLAPHEWRNRASLFQQEVREIKIVRDGFICFRRYVRAGYRASKVEL